MEVEARDSRETWLEKRKLRITSTMVQECVTTTNPESLLKRIMNRKDISHLPFVARGIVDEQSGVDYLLASLKNDCVEAQAYRIGFVVHRQHVRLGASPDRLLSADSKWSLVETKNWYETKRQKWLFDLPYLDRKLQLKRSHTLLSDSNSNAGNRNSKMLLCCARRRAKD